MTWPVLELQLWNCFGDLASVGATALELFWRPGQCWRLPLWNCFGDLASVGDYRCGTVLVTWPASVRDYSFGMFW